MALVILGLDGMNLNLLKWCKGEMPHLNKLLQKSAFGTLQSVSPPLSGPAWTTILTGSGVARHGFLNSFYYDAQMKLNIVDYDKVKQKHFYEIIHEKKGKVFLMDVPFSTARSISGDFLDSYFSSKNADQMVMPKNLLQKFPSTKRFINYKAKGKVSSVEDYLQSFSTIIENNGQIIKDVLAKREHDVMFFQITVIDWILHKASRDLKKSKNSKKAQVAKSLLSQIDNLIHHITTSMKKTDHFVIFSDHGGDVLKGTFYPNSWLIKQGYLKLKKNNEGHNSSGRKKNSPSEWIKSISSQAIQYTSQVARSSQFLRKLAKPIHRRFKKHLDSKVSLHGKIDIEKSTAAALIKNIPLIKVFETDPHKKEQIIQEIIEKLQQDLNLTAKDVKTFFKCETPQEEEHLRKFGDVMIDIKDFEIGAMISNAPFSYGDVMFHDYNAIFLATGPNIKHQEIKGNLQDIAPTILHLLGIKEPESMQGTPLPIVDDQFKPCFNPKNLQKEDTSIINSIQV